MKNEIENSGRGHRSHWGGVCGAIFDIRPALVSSVELKTAIKPRAISYIGFSVWSNTPVLYFHSAPVFLDLAMTRVRRLEKRIRVGPAWLEGSEAEGGLRHCALLLSHSKPNMK